MPRIVNSLQERGFRQNRINSCQKKVPRNSVRPGMWAQIRSSLVGAGPSSPLASAKTPLGSEGRATGSGLGGCCRGARQSRGWGGGGAPGKSATTSASESHQAKACPLVRMCRWGGGGRGPRGRGGAVVLRGGGRAAPQPQPRLRLHLRAPAGARRPGTGGGGGGGWGHCDAPWNPGGLHWRQTADASRQTSDVRRQTLIGRCLTSGAQCLPVVGLTAGV